MSDNLDEYAQLDNSIKEKEKKLGRELNHMERAELFRSTFGWEFKPGDGYGSAEPPLHSY